MKELTNRRLYQTAATMVNKIGFDILIIETNALLVKRPKVAG